MTKIPGSLESCCGCGARFLPSDGPRHAYMISSASCYQAFGSLLEKEYTNSALTITHRLNVDTYAVQHPGHEKDRRAVQSVGLHLARLMLQLENLLPPKETNDVMLAMGRYKESLKALNPPASFRITVKDVLPFAGTDKHSEKVREWATATWQDYREHQDYIRTWVKSLPL